MATTAIEMNPETVAVQCYRRRVQELTDVITTHLVRFRRIALGHLGNVADAEDAVQDALLSALTHVDQFKAQATMSTWLTTIVINSARMKVRRRSSQVQVALDESCGEQNLSLADIVPDTRPDPEEAYRKRQIAKALARATSRLSPTLRTTFQLRDVDGLSTCEAAHLLGVPAGTVKARLARARARLRKTLLTLRQGNVARVPNVNQFARKSEVCPDGVLFDKAYPRRGNGALFSAWNRGVQ